MLITAPRQSLAQFLQTWLEDTQRQSVRPRTYERYEEIVRLCLVPGLGQHQLQKLNAQQVQAFYAKKLREGLSPTTVNVFHGVLHKALDTARKWRLIAENVCDLVSPPHAAHFEFQPLSLEQVHRLLQAARGQRIEALLVLALVTGMRRGELLGLKWQDIDFTSGTLQVRRIMTRIPTKLQHNGRKGYMEAETKTKRSRRSILIVPFALDVLQQHRERQAQAKAKAGCAWQERDLVFCTSVGTPLNPDRAVLQPLKALLRETELPNIRFHDLRHSAATLLLSMGIHPKVVQEILGHSDISMTMDTYSHVLPSMQKEAIEKMGSVFESYASRGQEITEQEITHITHVTIITAVPQQEAQQRFEVLKRTMPRNYDIAYPTQESDGTYGIIIRHQGQLVPPAYKWLLLQTKSHRWKWHTRPAEEGDEELQ